MSDNIGGGKIRNMTTGERSIEVWFNYPSVAEVLLFLGQFNHEARVEIYCDHYQGDFPTQYLEVTEPPP